MPRCMPRCQSTPIEIAPELGVVEWLLRHIIPHCHVGLVVLSVGRIRTSSDKGHPGTLEQLNLLSTVSMHVTDPGLSHTHFARMKWVGTPLSARNPKSQGHELC